MSLVALKILPPNMMFWSWKVMETWARLIAMVYIFSPNTFPQFLVWFGVGAESSSWAATRKSTKQPRRRCTACQDLFAFSELARAPCGHEYCRGCLHDLFRTLIDDSLFPPRCCRQPITCGGGVRIFLTTDLIRQYEAMKVEVETTDRTYCSNTSCSSFIHTEHIANEKVSCPDCGTLTCTVCKSRSHLRDCPADTGLEQLLETARENGWQRCYNCLCLVELDVGCNHMTFVSLIIFNI